MSLGEKRKTFIWEFMEFHTLKKKDKLKYLLKMIVKNYEDKLDKIIAKRFPMLLPLVIRI